MENTNPGTLVIGHINVQSLEPHFTDISSILTKKKIHILAMSETWLKTKHSSSCLRVDHYQLVRHDRSGKGGGGVALYIHDSIGYRVVDQSPRSDVYCLRPEYLFVLCNVGSLKILVGVVYNPPKCGYWNEVEESLLCANSSQDYTLLLGDLNIDWTVRSTPCTILRESLESCSLTPLPFDHTHHTSTSQSTIDYICCSDISKVASYTQMHHPEISGHDLLLATLSVAVPRFQRRAITCRSLKHFDKDCFLRDLAAVDWALVHEFVHVDDMVHFFTANLVRTYDKHAPYVTFVPRGCSRPWDTQELRNLRNERNKAWARYKRTRKKWDRERYKHLRNLVKTATRNAISSHYRKRIASCKGANEMWKCVRELGLNGGGQEPFQLPVSVDELNEFYVRGGGPDTQVSLNQSVRISPDDRFYFSHVEPCDVIDAIKRMRSNARGTDDISNSLLRMSLPIILPTLLHILDQSLQAGIFPSQWKEAIVVPLPKCSNPRDKKDFRPISILPAPSKILEAVALKQINQFIDRFNLLDDYQSAYRSHHSTHTALLNITDDIRAGIDRGEVTLLAAIDFSKAFDCINVDLLIDKLIAYGFSDTACDWVRSFLSARPQAVRSPAGVLSTFLSRNKGVPQGTKSGPNFFSIYINDASSVLVHSKHGIYADDFTIYISGPPSDIPLLVERMNSDISRLVTWALANDLRINSAKTQAMFFGSRRFISQLRASPAPQLCVEDHRLEYSDTVKILGVTLDSTLSFRTQCTITAKKCNSTMARLRKKQDYLPSATKMHLVKALVFPHLDYCAGLFLDLSSELSTKLSRCMNAALRFATGLRKSDHISPAYANNNLLTYRSRRDYLCICLLASVLTSGQPAYLSSAFNFTNKSGTKRCSTLDLGLPHARTECYRNSYRIYVARLWNGIPVKLREDYPRSCFNSKVRDYFLNVSKTQRD